MSKRKGPRSAYQQGEDIADVIADLVVLVWELVSAPIKWVWRKVRRG